MPPCQNNAPVAQLDRAPGFEPGGCRFESYRARQFNAHLGFGSSRLYRPTVSSSVSAIAALPPLLLFLLAFLPPPAACTFAAFANCSSVIVPGLYTLFFVGSGFRVSASSGLEAVLHSVAAFASCG